MITEADLISKNYRKFSSSNIDFPYSDYFYQKCFEDEIGKRYSLEFVYYSAGKGLSESWKCHLNINGDENIPHTTLEFHRIENLNWAEEKCESFWQLMGRPYYEKFEE